MGMYVYANSIQSKAPVNDDAYMVDTFGDYVCVAIADGNGGHPGMVNIGNIAITLVRDYLSRTIHENTSLADIRNRMDDLFYMISRTYLSINGISEEYSSVYASLIVVVVEQVSMQGVLCSTGSTEAQLIRSGQYRRLNELYTEAFDLLNSNQITPEQLYSHPSRATLTSALGVFNAPRFDIENFQLMKDDILLIASDGIYRVTSPAGIVQSLSEMAQAGKNIDESVNGLLDKADSFESDDNCTLALLYVNEDNGAREAVQSERISRIHTAPISSIRKEEESLNTRSYPYQSRPRSTYPRNTIGMQKTIQEKKNERFEERRRNERENGGKNARGETARSDSQFGYNPF